MQTGKFEVLLTLVLQNFKKIKTFLILFKNQLFYLFKRYNEFISVEPVNYRINICNHCEVGSRVILFNEGRFPFLSWMSKSVSYAAYNVENIGGYFRLSFCFNYAGCVQKEFFERNKGDK